LSEVSVGSVEEALREAEERSRLLLDSATDYAIFTLDDQGGITSWNVGAQTLFGWKPEEVVGRHFEILFTPEDRAAGIPAGEMSRATSVGKAEEEGWRVRRDESRFWGAGRLLPLRRGGGFLKILRDRTEQRRNEELLQLSEARFRTLADNMPQLAWMADERGEILWFNQRWRDYTGLGEDADAAARQALLHPDDRSKVRQGFLDALARGKSWEETFQLRGKDGQYRWFLSRAVPLSGAGPGHTARWFGTNTDITRQREIEAALAEEGRALETLNQTAAVLSAELDLDRLIQSAVDAGVALTGAEFGAFFYNAIDARGESYMLYALSGVERSAFDKFPMPRNTAVFTPTFKGEGVVRSDDITKDPRYGKNAPHKGMPEGHLPVRSYLAVPVTSRSGDVLGGLFFGHSAPGMFDDRTERLIVGVAAQSSVAIDNARLYASAQREIAERRRVEAALRLSEQRSRTLTEAIPHLVWTCRPDGYCDYLSPQWVAYTGVPEAEQLGDRWTEALHPEDRQRAYEHWMGAVAGKHPYDIEYRLKRHDGEYRWFKVRGEAVRDDDGAVERWFGACTDIQDIVEARETLARSREALEAAVEARTQELRETNALLMAEIAERQQAEEALHQAQKMEAIGQLTGGVAHDFNNLLTAITGNLELLQRRLAAGNTEVGRYVDGAMTSARRAASLTQRLLAFSRRQALAPKAIDLGRLAADMEELIRRSLGEDIRIRMEGDKDLWATWADPNQMENALLNLTINARDAMPDGGTLTIETRNLELGAGQVGDLAPGDYVMLAVSDTGVGMTPEVAARAFDPFFTTKPIGQGTGLGLSQLYGFAKQSGGLAVIDSAPGKGATVRLYLPRHIGVADPEEEAHGLPEQSPPPVQSGRAETVLVVEDEALVRMLVVQTLEEAGYRVIESCDGPEALAKLEDMDRLDLLVTDVGLPGMNGRQLAELVRQQRPGAPVLFMTGYAHNAAVGGEDLEPGMTLIDKPFAIDALAARVDAILNG
jgi:PAS domain S-box-containing protein